MSGNETLHDKLRRLRKESPKPTAKGEIPVWFRARGEARRRRAAESGGETEGAPCEVPVTTGSPRNLVERENDRGPWHERRLSFAGTHRHGSWALRDIEGASSEVLARVARDPALSGIELSDAVYLDIETTGLSGGAGTIPFLVCLGRFCDGGFELWQGFMAGPEEEAALLSEVQKRLARHSTLVSFFGKSFDRHRLEDKMCLHGVPPPFAGMEHLDLYHPLTRLYRASLPNGRLGTMETALCGVARGSDLPGRFAPEAWYDFLAERPHRLEAVFQHNADDVLSLVVLAAHLGRTEVELRPDGGELEGCGRARALALARLDAEEGRLTEALVWLDALRTRTSQEGESEGASALELRAGILKRQGDPSDALRVLASLLAVADGAAHLRARIERAKLLEHAARDLEGALLETELALSDPALTARVQGELQHRRDRLRRRLI